MGDKEGENPAALRAAVFLLSAKNRRGVFKYPRSMAKVKSRRLQPSDVIGHCIQQGRLTERERPLSGRRSGGGWAQARILFGGALTLPPIGESREQRDETLRLAPDTHSVRNNRRL